MKIAIEGCCHGELNKIYETLLIAQQKQGIKIDLLICCGDFEAVRNENDLSCMACPVKYRKMQTFHEYYSGGKDAPFLTLFIGGNHEAANHMWELSYGGWVAPNIYYLGNAGVVQFGGLRIAGLSGIYKSNDYRKNHFEQPPYNDSTVRSAYHVRSCDIFRLKQLSGNIDIMLSHDWPEGIYHYGNKEQLVRWKPHFQSDISRGTLGSPPAMDLLKLLKPTYWFSAHLHVKFPALYPHDTKGQSSSDDLQGPSGGHKNDQRFTKFLSLDKCLPRRSFLQIIDVPVSAEIETPYQLTFDPEWLAILRSTEHLMSYTNGYWSPPTESLFTPTMEEVLCIEHTLFKGDLTIPHNFVQSAHPYKKAPKPDAVFSPHENPQTTQLCQRIGIRNPFSTKGGLIDHTHSLVTNPEEIHVDGDGDDSPTPMDTDHTHNPDEISLDDDDDGGPNSSEGGGWCIDTAGAQPPTKRPLLSLPPPSIEKNATSIAPVHTGTTLHGSADEAISTGDDEGSKGHVTESTGEGSKGHVTESTGEGFKGHVTESTGNDERSKGHVTESVGDDERSKGHSVGDTEGPVTGVKLKRRNVAMYTATEDDVDED